MYIREICMLTINEEAIEKISKYLLSIREEFQSELNLIENDISRLKLLVKDAEKDMKKLQMSFDSSYMVLSSSQVAKSNEFVEIESLNEIIKQRKSEIDILLNKKKIINNKIEELDGVILCTKI